MSEKSFVVVLEEKDINYIIKVLEKRRFLGHHEGRFIISNLESQVKKQNELTLATTGRN